MRPTVSRVVILVVWLCSWEVQLQVAMAGLYHVGGGFGWTNYDPSTNQSPNFTHWSSSQQFYPGDQFVFQYIPTFHTVHQLLDKASYEHCNFKNATQLDGGDTGVFTWEAGDVGTFYFACKALVEGFGYHCNNGQKVTHRHLSKYYFGDQNSLALAKTLHNA